MEKSFPLQLYAHEKNIWLLSESIPGEQTQIVVSLSITLGPSWVDLAPTWTDCFGAPAAASIGLDGIKHHGLKGLQSIPLETKSMKKYDLI